MFSHDTLTHLVRLAGLLQLSVLVASAVVVWRLDWRTGLTELPLLYRQLFWTYGGYIVGMVAFLGLLCLLFPAQLIDGSPLGRFLCGFIALFWGVRLSLQFVFDSRPWLTRWWLWAGEGVLTVLFVFFVSLFGVVVWL